VKLSLCVLCVSVVIYFAIEATATSRYTLYVPGSWILAPGSFPLFFQTKRRIIFYVVRIYQDAVNRLFFVFAGFAGLEVLIGLFHS
jgi:hypothetical protein